MTRSSISTAGGVGRRDKPISLPVFTTLPPCTAARRNQMGMLKGANGVADRCYVCEKTAADTYAWASCDAAGGGGGGATGPQGATGPTGPQGAAGSAGSQGPQGVAGSAGAQGPTGPQGVAGSGSSDWKDSVRVASTGNLNLAVTLHSVTVDGVTLTAGDRVLVKNQTTASENGIWLVGVLGAPARTSDANTSALVTPGATVYVEEGTANGQSVWTLTNTGTVTLGTTALTFSKIVGATGPTGPQGVKGDTGASGPQGTAVSAGSQGPQGVKGDTGTAGPQGAAGSAGAQGPTGAQGAQGVTGPTGPGSVWKAAVRLATTTSGTLATSFASGQTVDGETLATGDRILVKNQTDGKENGVYVVNASGAPTRASDANTSALLAPGTIFPVEGGAYNGGTSWRMLGAVAPVIGTDSIWFFPYGGSNPTSTAIQKGTNYYGSFYGLTAAVAGDVDGILPTQTGNSGKVLGTNGTNSSWVSGGGGSTAVNVQANHTTKGTSDTIDFIDGTNVTVSSPASDQIEIAIPAPPVTAANTVTLSNKTLDNSTVLTVKDANLTVQDDANATRQGMFDLGNVTAGNTRTLAFPDKTGTLALTSDLANPTVFHPPGLHATNLTTATALAKNTDYALYLGRAPSAITSLSVRCSVTTAAATITWAEVAVYSGPPVAGGNAGSLSRVGWANVAATFNSTGVKTTTVSLSGVAAGDHLWLVLGSQATTPFQLRGMLADTIQSGVFQVSGTGNRPSTTATVTFGLAGATVVPPWVVAFA